MTNDRTALGRISVTCGGLAAVTLVLVALLAAAEKSSSGTLTTSWGDRLGGLITLSILLAVAGLVIGIIGAVRRRPPGPAVAGIVISVVTIAGCLAGSFVLAFMTWQLTY